MSRVPGRRVHRGGALALRWVCRAGLALTLSGCAHALHGAHDPGVEPPVAHCEPASPPPTPAVLRGEAGGIVLVDFTVQADGTVADIHPNADDRSPDPSLFAATRDWLQRCKYTPARFEGAAIPVQLTKGLGFHEPYEIDRKEPQPADWTEALGKELSAPRIVACRPQDPELLDGLDDARLSLVVQRDGHAGDTRLAEHLGEEGQTSYPLAALWLRTCTFEPARNAKGEPVAVRIALPLLFGDAPTPAPARETLPLADGARIPVPQPTSNCDLHPWLPAQKSAAPGSSTAEETIAPLEVEYTVDAEGNASDIALLSSTRREVFHAVRRYLLGCRFMAAHNEDGEALRVRVRRTFHLRMGTRQLTLNGPQQRIIEGDPP